MRQIQLLDYLPGQAAALKNPVLGLIVIRVARVQLEKASQIVKEDAIIFDHLGDTYHKLGNDAKARENWEKALQIDPGNKDVKKKLKEIDARRE